jgi:hypothetical protein
MGVVGEVKKGLYSSLLTFSSVENYPATPSTQ